MVFAQDFIFHQKEKVEQDVFSGGAAGGLG
jgi:hypothetical protein